MDPGPDVTAAHRFTLLLAERVAICSGLLVKAAERDGAKAREIARLRRRVAELEGEPICWQPRAAADNMEHG